MSLRMNYTNLGGLYLKYFLIASAANYPFNFKSPLLQHTVFLLANFLNGYGYAPALAVRIYYKIISTILPPLPALQFLI
jgi:hypothetical protein